MCGCQCVPASGASQVRYFVATQVLFSMLDAASLSFLHKSNVHFDISKGG